MDLLAQKVAYDWMAKYDDQLPGGLADKGPPKDVDPKQVEKGIKVEMEHTDDPDVAREISYDHLTEAPRYYDKLETIEKHGGGLKVYLDDERNTPPGWTRVYWPDEAIRLLKSGRVAEISLDHDLGDDRRGTGNDVVVWIEEAVVTRGFTPPRIYVHSANTSARRKMEQGIKQIYRLHERFNKSAQNEGEH
jgi:hypothetical protein